MKYRIKNFKYINFTDIACQYMNNINNTYVTAEILKGAKHLDYVPYDQEFVYFDSFSPNPFIFDEHIYIVLKSEYGLFIVRDDNVEEIVEKEDILKQNGISKLIRSGDKTILIDSDNNKYITTKHPDDEEDLEKAVMILLLKKEGYTTNDIYTLIDCVDRR